jgi:DNA polymerase III subunit epsilon
MRFAAIDFETANASRVSACAMGIAIVDDGEIVLRKEWLIRPPSLYFSPGGTEIHGITAEMVEHSPCFDALWPEIERVIGDRPLVAHNSGFDMPVLQATLAHYDVWSVAMPFLCSCSLARRCWPDLDSHSLAALADRFGIIFRHHHAGEDAMVAARVVLHAAQEHGADSLEELAMRTCLRMGQVASGKYISCCQIPRKKRARKLTYEPV